MQWFLPGGAQLDGSKHGGDERRVACRPQGAVLVRTPSITVTVPPEVHVNAGGESSFIVQVAPQHIEGNVQVQFDRVPRNVSLDDFLIHGPPWVGQARVAAGPQANAGDTTIHVKTVGGRASASTSIRLCVNPQSWCRKVVAWFGKHFVQVVVTVIAAVVSAIVLGLLGLRK
jgi:hypothetical protein